MNTYPVAYSLDSPEQRNRLTVFFRYFMCIPHVIVAFFYGIAALLAVTVGWFAILFTGKFPPGLYEFVAGFLRFSGRLMAYYHLAVDQFPPFDGGEHPEYPVQVHISPPLESYSRVKVFFRYFLAIPIMIVAGVLGFWAALVATALWFVAVFTGKTSPGLTGALNMPLTYVIRATSYYYLLTETWPPFDENAQLAPATSAPALDRSPEVP